MKSFESYNPYVILLYFIFVTGICMLVMNPVILIIALISGFIYSVLLSGMKKSLLKLMTMAPMIIITAIINPVFNHRGDTILLYFPGGDPLTFESLLYGFFSGVMLSAVILWFSCFNKLFKSDKILYTTGILMPSVALVLSMVLGFIPRFLNRVREIMKSQKAMGRDMEKGSVKSKIKIVSDVFFSMLGWGLESSVETAQSMKARGFASGKRTSFSVYSFKVRDLLFLLFSIICIGAFIFMKETFYFTYYPKFNFSRDFSGIFLYGILCFAPIVIDLKEDLKWR